MVAIYDDHMRCVYKQTYSLSLSSLSAVTVHRENSTVIAWWNDQELIVMFPYHAIPILPNDEEYRVCLQTNQPALSLCIHRVERGTVIAVDKPKL